MIPAEPDRTLLVIRLSCNVSGAGPPKNLLTMPPPGANPFGPVATQGLPLSVELLTTIGPLLGKKATAPISPLVAPLVVTVPVFPAIRVLVMLVPFASDSSVAGPAGPKSVAAASTVNWLFSIREPSIVSATSPHAQRAALDPNDWLNGVSTDTMLPSSV